VTNDDALTTTRRLARRRGIFAGYLLRLHQPGWRLQVAGAGNRGKLIVSIVCDFGERYLSNPSTPSWRRELSDWTRLWPPRRAERASSAVRRARKARPAADSSRRAPWITPMAGKRVLRAAEHQGARTNLGDEMGAATSESRSPPPPTADGLDIVELHGVADAHVGAAQQLSIRRRGGMSRSKPLKGARRERQAAADPPRRWDDWRRRDHQLVVAQGHDLQPGQRVGTATCRSPVSVETAAYTSVGAPVRGADVDSG